MTFIEQSCPFQLPVLVKQQSASTNTTPKSFLEKKIQMYYKVFDKGFELFKDHLKLFPLRGSRAHKGLLTFESGLETLSSL